MSDVDHPRHYNAHPSGIEAITVCEYMSFNIGNAVKYLWRADHKGGITDLQKSVWYINREIERLSVPVPVPPMEVEAEDEEHALQRRLKEAQRALADYYERRDAGKGEAHG